jgi:hypothetical protein
MMDIFIRVLICSLFAALLVPAGAELIGMALTWLGCTSIRYGESLRAAHQAFILTWRSY